MGGTRFTNRGNNDQPGFTGVVREAGFLSLDTISNGSVKLGELFLGTVYANPRSGLNIRVQRRLVLGPIPLRVSHTAAINADRRQ